MTDVRSPLAYASASRSRFLSELVDFVRFPTVSALPGRSDDLRRCARWLAGHLRGIGLERVAVLETAGHPVVYGEWMHAPGRPTVLVYGHYDVQPADPLAAWRVPPFEPTVVGPDLFGRGASDDKGQVFVHVKALEAYLGTLERLPVNVKCLVEGEEEIGSPSLAGFLAGHERLAADVLLASDTRFLARGRPAITYALRGLAVSGARGDRARSRSALWRLRRGYSQSAASAVRNRVRLHDAAGRIAVPGFYDAVRPVVPSERAYMARVGPGDAQMLRDAMIRRGWGEAGYSLYERTTIRPSLTVTGLPGGYSGPGSKAVIPSRATAKIDVRLVPDQRPADIERLIRRHVARVAPATVRTSIRTLSSSGPVTVDRRDPVLRSAATAYRRGFGVPPVLLRLADRFPRSVFFRGGPAVPRS